MVKATYDRTARRHTVEDDAGHNPSVAESYSATCRLQKVRVTPYMLGEVAKLVAKWRERVARYVASGKPHKKSNFIDGKKEAFSRCAVDLEALLATAPPEQDDGVAQEEAQLLARYDKALQTQQAAPKLHGTFTIADLPEDQPQGIMPFDLNDWKRRFAYNSEAAERNSSMDSGWSARTADDCLRRAAMLWRELAIAIAKTDTKPEDLFDRPDLVDVQEAARFATTPIKEEHGRC